MDYQQKPIQLPILPLALWLEVQDIMFFISLIQFSPGNLRLEDYI